MHASMKSVYEFLQIAHECTEYLHNLHIYLVALAK